MKKLLDTFFIITLNIVKSIISKPTMPWRFAMWFVNFCIAADILFLYWAVYLKYYEDDIVVKRYFGIIALIFLILTYFNFLYKENYSKIIANYEGKKVSYIYHILYVVFIVLTVYLVSEYLNNE